MRTTRVWTFLLPTLAVVALASAASAQEHAYVGNKNCKKCHMKQWKSWSATKMAKAFDTLKPGERAEAKTAAGLDPDKDYTTDPNCVRCHVTGYGKEGGFVDVASTPDLVGVGCEMCHGAGGTYTQPEHMSIKNKNYKRADLVAVGLVSPVSEAQCVGCHNTESPFVGDDYVFDFAARKDEGTHEHYELKYDHD
jgi:hypothetical protein